MKKLKRQAEILLGRKLLKRELYLLKERVGFITKTKKGGIINIQFLCDGAEDYTEQWFHDIVKQEQDNFYNIGDEGVPYTCSLSLRNVKELINILDVEFPIVWDAIYVVYGIYEIYDYPKFFNLFFTNKIFYEKKNIDEEAFKQQCLIEYLEKTQAYALKYKDALCAEIYHKDALIDNMEFDKKKVKNILQNNYLDLIDKYLNQEVKSEEEAEIAKKYANKNANWLINLAKNPDVIYVYQEDQYNPCFYWEHMYRANDNGEFHDTYYDLLVTTDENGRYNAVPVEIIEKLIGIKLCRELFDNVISKNEYFKMKNVVCAN